MPRSPHDPIPHFTYASLAPSRERKRRRQRALLLFSLASLSCALLFFLLVRRNRGEATAERGRRGGQRKTPTASATAAAVETAALSSTSSSSSSPSSYLSAAQRDLIRSAQPATRNISADGSGFRLLRVASARREALERELERRRRKREKKQRSESGESGESGNSNRSPTSTSLLSPPASELTRSYVAACVVLRDQSEDLPEFVAWHAALGIKTFYLYDDRSAVPLTPDAALRGIEDSSSSSSSSSFSSSSSSSSNSTAWASKGGVDVFVKRLSPEEIEAHPSKRAQMTAYDDCCARSSSSSSSSSSVSSSVSSSSSKSPEEGAEQKHSWLAFLDVDEFVVLSSPPAIPSLSEKNEQQQQRSSKHATPSLPKLLSEFEDAGAAAVLLHWRVFGSSGRVSSKPRSLSTPEAFTSCLPAEDGYNAHVKTIASTKFLDVAEPCLGPHHFAFWDLDKAADFVEDKMKEEIGGGDDDDDAVTIRRKHVVTEAVGIGVEGKKAWLLAPPLPSPPARFAVDVEGRRLDGAVRETKNDNDNDNVSSTPFPFYPAFLAHYAIKSRQDYSQKMARGSAMGNRKTWEFFDGVDARATEECSEARELSRKMRQERGTLLVSDDDFDSSSAFSASSSWFLRQRR